jgi:Na+-driven multidrug efflux pump
MQSRTDEFLSDPVFPLLVRMSAPNTIAFFIQAIVVLAEVWFISKLGTISLAAVALAFPIIMLTQQMAFGALGGAVTSSIARSLGAGDKERAEKLLWHSLFLAACGGLFFLFIFLIGGEFLLLTLGGRGLLLQEALSYCLVFLSGATIIWFSGTLSAALRGMGNMRFPAMLMIAGSGIQIILGGSLILGWFGVPALGLIGAPIAAISTATFITLVMFLKLMHSSSEVQLKLSLLYFEKELFKDIFTVALPASLSPVFTVGTILVLTGLVGQFGDSALAGYGIGSRIEFLMIPLVGGSVAGFFSGIIGLILFLTSDYWISLFATDQATYIVTKQYIEIVGLCFGFQGLGLSLYFASQGANAMKWPIFATISRFIVAALGGWISVNYFSTGISGIFYSAAAAMTLFGLMLGLSLKMGAWRKH